MNSGWFRKQGTLEAKLLICMGERGGGYTFSVEKQTSWSAEPQEDWELKVSYSESRSGWGEGLAETANKEQWTPGPFLPTHPARKPLPTGKHKTLDFMGALSDRGSGSRTGKTCLVYPHHRCDENIRELGVGCKKPETPLPSSPFQTPAEPHRSIQRTALSSYWTKVLMNLDVFPTPWPRADLIADRTKFTEKA